jgi:hypothetical protein
MKKLTELVSAAPTLKSLGRTKVEAVVDRCVADNCNPIKLTASSDQPIWTMSVYGGDAAPNLAVAKAFASVTVRIQKSLEVSFVCDNSTAGTVSTQDRVTAHTTLFKLFAAGPEYNCIAQVAKVG